MNTKDIENFVEHNEMGQDGIYIPFENGGNVLLAPNGKPSNLTAEQYRIVRTPAFKNWFGDWEKAYETGNYDNVSKVIDEETKEPLVVYHGTNSDMFYEFNSKLTLYSSYRNNRNHFVDSIEVAKSFGKNVIAVFLKIKKPKIFDYQGAEYTGKAWGKVTGDYGTYFNPKFIKDVNKSILFSNKGELIKRAIELGHNEDDIWIEYDPQFQDDINDIAETIENSSYYDGIIAKNIHDVGMKSSVAVVNPIANQYIIFNSKNKYRRNQIKLADGTNTTFDSNNPDIRYADGGNIEEVKNYLRNIREDEGYNSRTTDISEGIQYRAKFGRDGGITWRIYLEQVNSIYIASIDRYATEYIDVLSLGKKDSRGEGAMAIASLFLRYPKVNTLEYNDESSTEFWQKIGGNEAELKREDFFKYFENKFGYNPDRVEIKKQNFMAVGKITKNGGDCYYIAGQFTMGIFAPKKIDYIGTPYLVHAEVQGQGHISNIRYGHAWIEDDINVYDFSNNRELIIPKLLYYAIGDIKTDNPKKYRKYTFQEARKKMVDTKHYGCWDLEVDYANGGTINEKPNYRFYKATINNKDIFPVKISTKDERHSDMLNMFNELHERGYILKEITKEEFENFDYSNVSKKDIQDFMSGLSYYEIGGTIVNSKNKNNVVPLFIDTEGRLELREDINGNYANNWEFYTSPKIINSLLRYFKIPIKAVKELGTGSYGVAFLTDKKKVLKITNNANEAYTSFVIMKNKSKLKTQAEVYNVFKISRGAAGEDSQDFENSLYLIEKQLVPEVLSDVVEDLKVVHDEIDEYFQSLIGQLHRYHINKEIKKIRDLDVYEFLMEQRYEMDSPNKHGDDIVIYYANKIKEFYLELGKDEAKTDLDFSDVHSGNAGFLNKKFVCFDCAMGNVSLFNIGGSVSKSKLFIPNVRGGWTKNKIIKYLKNKSSDYISTLKLLKYISEFDNWQQFKDHIYYHGTKNYIERGLTPSITMSEREVERIGGGGYGQRYFGVSLTKRKRTAESFSGMSSSVTIYPIILKRDANVIERTDLQDAADIEDIIVELYEKGVDAVWIGGGEEELVVINPYSILLYKNGREHHNVYGGFKSIPLTDEKIKEIYDNSYNLFEKYSEEYKSKQSKEERENFIKSIPKIQFELGGEITLTSEQVEQKLGRKLHWWKDNMVSINGIVYKKVFLKNEYNLL